MKNFKKNEKGIEHSNDHIYEGNFNNDCKEGEGLITFKKSGDIFNGIFKENKIFKGKYQWKSNNNIYEGYFENNKMHGEGTYTYSSGKGNLYTGNYKNGKKHGYGIIKENGKIVYEGDFFEGNPHGKGFRYDKKGAKFEVNMEMGKVKKNTENDEKMEGDSRSPFSKKIGLSKICLFLFFNFYLTS